MPEGHDIQENGRFPELLQDNGRDGHEYRRDGVNEDGVVFPATCDRLFHNAYRIDLKGDTIRNPIKKIDDSETDEDVDLKSGGDKS